MYAYLLSPSSALFRGGGGGGGGDSTTTNTNNTNDPSSYYLSDSAYAEMHGRILQLESRILLALSFDTHVALPHGLAITYLQALDYLGQSSSKQSSSNGSGDEDNKDKDKEDRDVARRAIAHLNTALLSPQLLYLTHQPHALAVAAVYGAARDAGARMPECAWWEVFDVDREELGFLVVAMRSLEGWVRRQQETFAQFGRDGMVTRRFVEGEMRRRGLRLGGEIENGNGNGVGNAKGLSEEDAMMRQMDETVVPMED